MEDLAVYLLHYSRVNLAMEAYVKSIFSHDVNNFTVRYQQGKNKQNVQRHLQRLAKARRGPK